MSRVCPGFPGINSVYLFGSRAKGGPEPKDYDLAILVDERRVSGQGDRHALEDGLFGALMGDLKPLDLVMLNDADNVLVQEVLRHKVLLYCADHSYRVAWEVAARYRIWDMEPYKARYTKALHDRILGGDP